MLAKAMASGSSSPLKIVLLGSAGGCGKSTMLQQFSEYFCDNITTIGIVFKIRRATFGKEHVKLQLWDTAGNIRFLPINIAYIRGARGILVVFDLTDRRTLDKEIPDLLKVIDQHSQENVIRVLVGNKSDMVEHRQVSRQRAEEFAAANGMPYFETSAKDHASVCAPVFYLAEVALERRPRFYKAQQEFEGQVPEQVAVLQAPAFCGWTPMHHAAYHGQVGAIEAFQELGRRTIDDIDMLDRTPLFLAAFNGQPHAVETLVRLGSKAIETPNKQGCTPLLIASQYGHATVVETLGRLCSDTIAKAGEPALHEAAARGHTAVVGALLRLGSTNIRTDNDRTLVHMASHLGFLPMIEELCVFLGTDVLDSTDSDGLTPMHMAAASGRSNIVEALVRLGSKAIDSADSNGLTPMHMAARNGSGEYGRHVGVINTLVRLGSQSIDATDKQGRTPLHYSKEDSRVPDALVKKGSRAIDRPDNAGKKPFDHLHSRAQAGEPAAFERLVQLGSRLIETRDWWPT